MTEILATDALTRRFGDLIAVDSLTMSVGDGEVFGLLGRNGAGKTTLIKMLTKLLPPASGTAKVGGYDVATQSASVRAIIVNLASGQRLICSNWPGAANRVRYISVPEAWWTSPNFATVKRSRPDHWNNVFIDCRPPIIQR